MPRTVLKGLNSWLESERAVHDAKLAGIRQRVHDSEAVLERTRYLVERDASPRTDLLQAEADLRQAEAAERQQLTLWTSRLNNLQTQIRDAELTVVRAGDLAGEPVGTCAGERAD